MAGEITQRTMQEKRAIERASAARARATEKSPLRATGGGGFVGPGVGGKARPDPTYDAPTTAKPKSAEQLGSPVVGGTSEYEYVQGPGGEMIRQKKVR